MTHRLLTGHTADLDRGLLDQAHALLRDVFDDLAPEDWEHSLGGVHAVVLEGGRVVGHGALVQRRLLHAGRALRAGYVEGVAVRADRRGHGHGAAMMAALERVARGGYEIAALGSSDDAAGFYTARGWQPWRGRLLALTPQGITPTDDERGGVLVLPLAVPLDLDGELTCDWRDGDVW